MQHFSYCALWRLRFATASLLAGALLLAAPLEAQPALLTFGGPGSVVGSDVAIDPSGHAVVTGRFEGTVDFDPGPSTAFRTSLGFDDVFVARYDASGTLVSVVTFGGPHIETGNAVAVDASGHAVVTGFFMGTVDFDPGPGIAIHSPAGGSDVFVARYDGNGVLVSVIIFGGTDFDEGRSITVDTSGHIVVTGAFYGMVDFDPSSGTANRMSVGSNDVFVARYDGNGVLVSVVTFGGIGDDIGDGVVLDASRHAVVTGFFWDTVDFDPGSGIVNRTSEGLFDVYVVRYDASGALVAVTTFGSAGQDAGHGVAVDAGWHAVVTGQFSNTVDFDPGTATVSGTSVGKWGAYVTRYDASGALVMSTNTAAEDNVALLGGGDMRVSGVWPNPTRGVSRLRIEARQAQRVHVRMYDVLGQRVADVFEGTLTAGTPETVSVETAGLPAGVYVVRVEGERVTTTRALVVR